MERASGKSKKHGTDGKRRVWRKLHIAVDTSTYQVIAAELSLSNVSNGEVLSNLLKQTRRRIVEVGLTIRGIATQRYALTKNRSR